MATYYYGDEVHRLMDAANQKGYQCIPFADTVCGLGSFVLVPPDGDIYDDTYYKVIVTEHYATEWTCKYTVRRRAKLSKKLLKAIEDFEREGE